jgi:A nuclease family of the HNH/ENDO VII superfamily with conserved AHH
MTQVGEAAMVGSIADEEVGDNCPFCYKKKHDFPSKKFPPDVKVVSKPKDLGCSPLPVTGEWRHTTAAHHLISAKQCYAKVRRLVRMASMVGYDINNPNNGISLPTVANNITYSLHGSPPKKYGRFTPDEKRQIAFGVMDQAKAQWHVGHHAVTVEIPEDWADEVDTSLIGHTVSYDEAVIKELLALLDEWAKEEWCEAPEDQSESIKSELDELSDSIHSCLDQFGTGQPRASTPFFVSELAHAFANASPSERTAQEQDDYD